MPEVFVGKKEQTEELTEAVYSTLIETLLITKQNLEDNNPQDAKDLAPLIGELRYAYESLTREWVDEPTKELTDPE